MSDRIRASVSKKNKYYISKHRYYELKHFCLQYYEWKDLYFALEGIKGKFPDGIPHGYERGDPTANLAMLRAMYAERMRMIEQACIAADASIYGYIFQSVTKEVPFNYLKSVENIPCEKDYFYDRRRKFFWVLDQMRK